MKNLRIIVAFLICSALLIGCGETVRGVGKDVNRIGYGVKTIFVSPK